MIDRTPSRRSPAGQAGFTLVEVIVASMVLVLAFFGMIQTLTVSSEMMATARRQTLASNIIDHEIEKLRTVDWTVINTMPKGATVMNTPWNSSTNYKVEDTVVRNGNWYRCTVNHTNVAPPNTGFWKLDPPPYSNAMDASGVAEGVTFVLTRTIGTVSPDLLEIMFAITWTVQPSGGVAPRTHTRMKSGYFGKYGLNLTYQRS